MSALRDRLQQALVHSVAPSSDFDHNPEVAPLGGTLRDAGVLLALREDGRLILTKRASGLRHHPGQIALPGGKVDPGDADPTAAALREAHEEVGLDPATVEVLGRLSPHHTVTGFAMTPVVGLIRGGFTPVREAGEVDEVFEVPLEHVLALDRYRAEGRLWRGTWRRYWVVPWGPYYIWGATARILRGLALRMGP